MFSYIDDLHEIVLMDCLEQYGKEPEQKPEDKEGDSIDEPVNQQTNIEES